MDNKIYLIFLIVDILIIIVNYHLLKNPKPYPPEEVRKEFKSGGVSLASSKFVGSSHYLLPRLVQSQANWENGNAYWYRSGIKLGIFGIGITLITAILGEVFRLFDPLVGLFIILIPWVLGMIYMCIRIEKDILKD
ncbi:hypothetical protein [uncultured Anaerococcus sp.]|uniref:hypothetical protein n=1 Tax=uncultured Anaerococcus sp. TaxID=293428 RepID=UPI0028890F41|nr:hypothetical protein [uncultured Anaerococcus sp.]